MPPVEWPTRTYGAVLTGRGQQQVQILRGGHTVLRTAGLLAPPLTGAVVGTDPGRGADLVGDPGPGAGELAEAVEEHHRRATLTAAVEVQPVAGHLVGLARGGVRVVVADEDDVLGGGADARGGEDHEDERDHPST